jgi:hypothetical protein
VYFDDPADLLECLRTISTDPAVIVVRPPPTHTCTVHITPPASPAPCKHSRRGGVRGGAWAVTVPLAGREPQVGVRNKLQEPGPDAAGGATAGYRDLTLRLTLATREACELGLDAHVCEVGSGPRLRRHRSGRSPHALPSRRGGRARGVVGGILGHRRRQDCARRVLSAIGAFRRLRAVGDIRTASRQPRPSKRAVRYSL